MSLIFALFFTLLSLGCDGNCQVLAKVICTCEASEAEQIACKRGVDDEAKQRTSTIEAEEQCGEILEQCTEESACQLIEEGELAACGLANF